jgi:hypothetical protein
LDYYASQNTSAAAARAASLAGLEKSRSDFHADQSNSAAASRSASLAVLPSSSSEFSIDLRDAPAAASAVTIRPSHYARLGNLTASEAASLGYIMPAPLTLSASHYARLGSLTAAENASLGNIVGDEYSNSWMGFTAPESVGASLSAAEYAAKSGIPAASVSMPNAGSPRRSVNAGSAADPSSWIKPEGIRPAAAGGADQLQWIKPEGIKASGAK